MRLDKRYDDVHRDVLGVHMYELCASRGRTEEKGHACSVVGIPFVERFMNRFVLPLPRPIYVWVLRGHRFASTIVV